MDRIADGKNRTTNILVSEGSELPALPVGTIAGSIASRARE